MKYSMDAKSPPNSNPYLKTKTNKKTKAKTKGGEVHKQRDQDLSGVFLFPAKKNDVKSLVLKDLMSSKAVQKHKEKNVLLTALTFIIRLLTFFGILNYAQDSPTQ